MVSFGRPWFIKEEIAFQNSFSRNDFFPSFSLGATTELKKQQTPKVEARQLPFQVLLQYVASFLSNCLHISLCSNLNIAKANMENVVLKVTKIVSKCSFIEFICKKLHHRFLFQSQQTITVTSFFQSLSEVVKQQKCTIFSG